jgi:ACS family hexuronate transporter-like MFS transporter
MSVAVPDLRLPGRSHLWKWWVCGLLLLATMVNYMDRLTLTVQAGDMRTEMGLDEADYGHVQAGFSLAFAFGGLFLGWLADRWNAVWLYGLTVLVWSAAGFCTGFVGGFWGLLVCRSLLGLSEAGHWPCALRTTQAVLRPAERTLGNAVLQSGAAFGSVLIPLVIFFFFPSSLAGAWRAPFWVVGACGAAWAGLWWVSVRPADVPARPAAALAGPARPPVPGGLVVRRFVALVVLVILINATWHFFAAWITMYMAKMNYDKPAQLLFTSAYFAAAALGTLSAGGVTLLLARGGLSVHRSRLVVLLAYGSLTGMSVWAAFLPQGWLLLAVLLVVGFGSLGVFPAYYSLSQELTVRHQGKLTGVLGFLCWMALAGWQELIGQVVKATQSYTFCMVLAGVMPLAGFGVLVALWGPAETGEVPAAPELPLRPSDAAAPAGARPAADGAGVTTGGGAVLRG